MPLDSLLSCLNHHAHKGFYSQTLGIAVLKATSQTPHGKPPVARDLRTFPCRVVRYSMLLHVNPGAWAEVKQLAYGPILSVAKTTLLRGKKKKAIWCNFYKHVDNWPCGKQTNEIYSQKPIYGTLLVVMTLDLCLENLPRILRFLRQESVENENHKMVGI